MPPRRGSTTTTPSTTLPSPSASVSPSAPPPSSPSTKMARSENPTGAATLSTAPTLTSTLAGPPGPPPPPAGPTTSTSPRTRLGQWVQTARKRGESTSRNRRRSSNEEGVVGAGTTTSSTPSTRRPSFDNVLGGGGSRLSFEASALARPNGNGSDNGSTTSLSGPSNATTASHPSRSKPPVSLPSFFRRRNSSSSSSTNRPPFASSSSSDLPAPPPLPSTYSTTARRPSLLNSQATSEDSIDYSTVPPTSSSSQAAIRVPRAPRGVSEMTTSTTGSSGGSLNDGSDERRSSLETVGTSVEGVGLNGQSSRRTSAGSEQERAKREDLTSFIKASDPTTTSSTASAMPSLTTSPTSLTSPIFPSPPSRSTPTFPSSTSSVSPPPPRISPPLSTIAASPPLQARRNTANLTLPDLPLPPRASPPLDAPATTTTTTQETVVAPSATQRRMQALPRLLSRDAYSFVTLAQATASTSSAVAPPASTAVEVVAPLEADGGGAAGDGDSEEEEESGTEMEESEESEETETEGEEETSDDDEGGEPVQRPTRLPRLPSNLLMSTVPDSTSTSTTTEEASAPATNGWVTFDPVTPTPTPGISSSTRTPRFLGSASNAEHSDSYFDVRRNPRNASPSQTPGAGGAGAPLRTPLLPMSLGNVTRGKRPTHEDDVVEVEGTGASTSVGVVPSGALAVPGVVAPNTTTEEGGLASPLYRRRRHSAIELLSPSLLDSEGRPLGGVGAAQTHEGLDLGVWNNAGARTPGPAFLTLPTPLLTPAISPTILTTNVSSPSTTTTTNSNPPLATPSSSLDPVSPAIATSPISPSPNNRLHRPRSMYELHVAPPEYHSLSHRSPFGLPGGVVGRGGTKQVVAPREEEGKEKLPRYSCAIHLEGYMPRKLEFTAPSVQAKDRAWKRQYVVLHGTSIKIYRYDLRTHPIAGEASFSTLHPTTSTSSSAPLPLHFHPGEYGVDPSSAEAQKRFPSSLHDARNRAKSRIVEKANRGEQNVLVRTYSLQNAESGLAADYIKRKHVVRVRAEGEQFLLQTTGDRGTIDLIEVLQAATNVSLDLDTRPLPKFITLPRRRRRRRRVVDPTAPATGAGGATASAGGGGAAAATVGGEARRESPETAGDRLGDMLAEEQHAYSQSNDGATIS